MNILRPEPFEFCNIHRDRILPILEDRLLRSDEKSVIRLLDDVQTDIIESCTYYPKLKQAIKQAGQISKRLTKAQIRIYEIADKCEEKRPFGYEVYINLKWNLALLLRMEILDLKPRKNGRKDLYNSDLESDSEEDDMEDRDYVPGEPLDEEMEYDKLGYNAKIS